MTWQYNNQHTKYNRLRLKLNKMFVLFVLLAKILTVFHNNTTPWLNGKKRNSIFFAFGSGVLIILYSKLMTKKVWRTLKGFSIKSNYELFRIYVYEMDFRNKIFIVVKTFLDFSFLETFGLHNFMNESIYVQLTVSIFMFFGLFL